MMIYFLSSFFLHSKEHRVNGKDIAHTESS